MMPYEPPVYIEQLTPREREVLLVLAQEGLTNGEIGAKLYISVKTVEKHLANIYQKLGFTRRAEAIIWARQHLLQG